jgi:sugar phosphate isomerase/epimerase
VIDRARLSLNLITVDHWSLPEAVDRCADAGIGWVAPWRHQYEDAAAAADTIRSAGLRVSSLCRGGFFTADGAREDNRRAVEEAAALGAPVLVLVCGPPRDRDLRSARATIAAGIEELLPYASEHGVRLGIEPLHPMMIGERSAIVSLGEALRLARTFADPGVGVVVDAFWDAALEVKLAAASGLVAGYHVSDWLVPTESLLAGRGLMGDGIIDLPRIRALVEAAGYTGPIEVEIISAAEPSLDEIVARFPDG